MNLDEFCLTRPEYPYTMTTEELEYYGLRVHSLILYEPVYGTDGAARIEVSFKPHRPVEYIIHRTTFARELSL